MKVPKKFSFCGIMLVSICLSAIVAQADVIVDTGQIGGGDYRGGYSLSKGQWLAGQFSLSQPYVITQVQGLIGYLIDIAHPALGNAGDIKAVIYTNSNGLPGNKLQIQTFTSSNPGFDTWQGPSGLNWTLKAGTYWLAFEVDASSTFAGAMRGDTANQGFNDNATAPLAHYAVANASHLPAFIYFEPNADLNLGMRVYGDLSSAPLPGTILLLGSGLACLNLRSRRKLTANNQHS